MEKWKILNCRVATVPRIHYALRVFVIVILVYYCRSRYMKFDKLSKNFVCSLFTETFTNLKFTASSFGMI
jgi:hypothetical protein